MCSRTDKNLLEYPVCAAKMEQMHCIWQPEGSCMYANQEFDAMTWTCYPKIRKMHNCLLPCPTFSRNKHYLGLPGGCKTEHPTHSLVLLAIHQQNSHTSAYKPSGNRNARQPSMTVKAKVMLQSYTSAPTHLDVCKKISNMLSQLSVHHLLWKARWVCPSYSHHNTWSAG